MRFNLVSLTPFILSVAFAASSACTKKAEESAPSTSSAVAPAGNQPAAETAPVSVAPANNPALNLFANVFKLPGNLEPNSEQQKKLEELKQNYLPKLQAVQEKLQTSLTPEQKAARAKAVREAYVKGTRGQELVKIGETAAKISAEQKKNWDSAMAEMSSLRQEVFAAIRGLLSEDQLKKMREESAKQRASIVKSTPSKATESAPKKANDKKPTQPVKK